MRISSLRRVTGHETIALSGSSSCPTVLANAQTFDDIAFVDTRIVSVSANSVSVALEEGQLNRFSTGHGVETIGHLAIERGEDA
ncbi:MAG: hypothetical protein AAF968_11275 [Pseudomonadota bacterium]